MGNDEQALAIREQSPVTVEALHFSPAIIQGTKREIALMQNMVRDMLTRGVDYGRVPGTPKDSLWDPGAQMVVAAFNCYFGERRILKLEDDERRISVIVEVPVISRSTGQVVATGIGAASTLETKYKYRWMTAEEAGMLGYTEEALYTYKRDTKNNKEVYRVPNPEQSELLNTIVKIAAKRGEVDASQSLPGVASALRGMFDNPQGNQYQQRRESRSAGVQSGQKITTWDTFWGEIRRMGLEATDVYRILGVDHVKQWLDSNSKNLDECLSYILKHHLDKATGPALEEDLNYEPPFGPTTEKIEDIGAVWDEIRTLVKDLKINQKGLQNWWSQYDIRVLLDDFQLADIPEKLKADQIQAFHKSLRELAAQRARGNKQQDPGTQSRLT